MIATMRVFLLLVAVSSDPASAGSLRHRSPTLPDSVTHLAVESASVVSNHTVSEAALRAAQIDQGLNLAASWQLMAQNTSCPDHIQYGKCASALSQAWMHFQQQPCSSDHWKNAASMRQMVPTCREISLNSKQGDSYQCSYRELLKQGDTWCGRPKCTEPCPTKAQCQRDFAFPFEPVCSAAMAETEELKIKMDKNLAKSAAYSGAPKLAGIGLMALLTQL